MLNIKYKNALIKPQYLCKANSVITTLLKPFANRKWGSRTCSLKQGTTLTPLNLCNLTACASEELSLVFGRKWKNNVLLRAVRSKNTSRTQTL